MCITCRGRTATGCIYRGQGKPVTRLLAALAALALLVACSSSPRKAPMVTAENCATPAASSSASASSTPLPVPPGVNPCVAATWPQPIDGFTPGSTTAGCTYPVPVAERAVSSTVKRIVAGEYKVTVTGLANVEYDHRIPFSLCGDGSANNIWPELYDGVPQTTYVHNRKDQLEAFAAAQVRYHRWSLPFAQAVFRGDWRAAWCKYTPRAGVAC